MQVVQATRPQIIAGNYHYRRPDFSYITDADFDKAKVDCFSVLTDRAKKRLSPIPYKALANSITSIAYPFDDDPLMHALACIIGEISLEEFNAGRALLSALVVIREEGAPGSGFFDLAKGVGRAFDDETTYWAEEIRRIYSQKYI